MSSCSYTCSETPQTLVPYTDITGIGVVIGYMGSAGLVVLIVLVYYLTSYDPAKDPFQTTHQTKSPTQSVHFQPNPFDDYLLSAARKLFVRISNGSPSSSTILYKPRVEAVYVKSVVAMSDLQILTGLSILISGFTQLRCGISCYHWQLLTFLAWFSSLTHLACLTVLRRYLYEHQAQRAWRLAAMGIFILMLLVALYPTANYNWSTGFQGPWTDSNSDSIPSPMDYAVCYFQVSGRAEPETFVSMVISFLLLILAFLSRVVRLHKSLSINVAGRARQGCSEKIRHLLRKVYQWCQVERSPNSLKRSLIYRPLLAAFLVSRVLLDAWSSMFFEVIWLLAAFVWGSLRFLSTLLLFPQGDSDWTFGQVVPVVLLASPLLAVVEYIYPDESEKRTETISSSVPASNPTSTAAVVSSQQTPPPPMHTSPPNSPTMTIPSASSLTLQASTPHASATTSSMSSITKVNSSPAHLQTRVQTLQIAVSTHLTPPDRVRDDPDYDFFGQSQWYRTFILFVSIDIVAVAVQFLVLVAFSGSLVVDALAPKGLLSLVPLLGGWFPLNQFFIVMPYVLCVFLIETVRVHPVAWKAPGLRRIVVGVSTTLVFLGLLIAPTPYLGGFSYIYCFFLALYLVSALIYRIFG